MFPDAMEGREQVLLLAVDGPSDADCMKTASRGLGPSQDVCRISRSLIPSASKGSKVLTGAAVQMS